MLFYTITYIIIVLALMALIGYGYYKDYKKSPGYFKFTLKHLGWLFVVILIATIAYYFMRNNMYYGG